MANPIQVNFNSGINGSPKETPRKGKRRPPGLQFKIEQPKEDVQPPPVPPIQDSKVKIMYEGKEFEIDACDLITIRNLGRGAYGIVDLVRHRTSGAVLAVKRIPMTVNSQEQKRLLMDLDVNMRSGSCPYTVTFMVPCSERGMCGLLWK